MRLIITGSPGVGKTSTAKALGKALKYKVVNEKEFAVDERIGKWSAKEDELIIPLEQFAKSLKELLEKEEKIILEGHMLCELKLPADFVILLRCHPEILESRLEARGYTAEKVQDNVFCEGIDYCKKHVLRRYPKEKVIELDVKKTIKETTAHIIEELGEKGKL
ncbi:MAG: hypothetical protein CL943_01165 [Candidatus Diapherotrites archaeon]|uniref:AAA family ATPase n=1 Tax=Candidatus Iainarchaeum sp. TaxID=3101447 RepID=A0A2D6M0G4_9ARCH|nr:hypothetical protein [Candidatus Diapherotrites archaeon]|tara:strand:+ start:4840 stop:5331 length:492 start_codon:yes stop_codon:yes gene_type:complete